MKIFKYLGIGSALLSMALFIGCGEPLAPEDDPAVTNNLAFLTPQAQTDIESVMKAVGSSSIGSGLVQNACNTMSAKQGQGSTFSPTLRMVTGSKAATIISTAASIFGTGTTNTTVNSIVAALKTNPFPGFASTYPAVATSAVSNQLQYQQKCALRQQICRMCSSTATAMDGAYIQGENKNYMCVPTFACAKGVNA